MSSGKKIITASTTSATLKHNGVTWTYSNPGTNQAITITGTGINIYKSKNGNNGYQTYFGTTEANKPKDVTVTITLVPASTGSTGRATK